jgi:hypothetical protein
LEFSGGTIRRSVRANLGHFYGDANTGLDALQQTAPARELRDQGTGAIDRRFDPNAITQWNNATHHGGTCFAAPEFQFV